VGERHGVLGAQQVRPTDGADEQRAPGEEDDRLVRPGPVGDGESRALNRSVPASTASPSFSGRCT
jgi:hypothetical protein